MDTIRDLRRARGWTQKDLARAVGVTTTTVHYWERGLRAPYVVHLRAVARAFGVAMEDIRLIEREQETAA